MRITWDAEGRRLVDGFDELHVSDLVERAERAEATLAAIRAWAEGLVPTDTARELLALLDANETP